MRIPLQLSVAAVVLASATTAQAQMRFQAMDANRDGMITRSEWRGNDRSFRNQDWNGDGILSGDEVRAGGRRQSNWSQDFNRDGRVDHLDSEISQRFRAYDTNNDNRVGRTEWSGDARLFSRLDTSRDGYVSMQEYAQAGDADVTNETARSAAWRSGHDRGTEDGRAAGREDYTRRQGWDLEGQRELESADSGYTSQVGTMSDYQAGYRDGFRAAYRAGFTEAGGRAPR